MMELALAALTGVLAAGFFIYVLLRGRATARRLAGELLAVLPRRDRRSRFIQLLVFVLLLPSAFMQVDSALRRGALSQSDVFTLSFLVVIFTFVVVVRPGRPEFRRRGLIPMDESRWLVPWSRVECVKRRVKQNRLEVRLINPTKTLVYSMAPSQLAEIEVAIAPYVELRDELGRVLNPDRPGPEPIDLGALPRRTQFTLGTLLLFMVVVASASAWWAVSAQEQRRREAPLVRLEPFGPRISGYPEYGTLSLNFSASPTPPGDDDLALLADVEGLNHLDLSGCPITDAGLAHLAGLTSLKYLSLLGTRVTDAGVIRLREALPDTCIVWTPGLPGGPPTPNRPPPPAAPAADDAENTP